jgi:hypothetical protein
MLLDAGGRVVTLPRMAAQALAAHGGHPGGGRRDDQELTERIGTSPRVALRCQHVMADRQARLASALDDLARAATAKPKSRQRARRR